MSAAAFWIREAFVRLRLLVSHRPAEEIDEELRFHLEQAVEANLAAGMTPAEARRRAMVALLAILIPARAAMRVEPVVALRCE